MPKKKIEKIPTTFKFHSNEKTGGGIVWSHKRGGILAHFDSDGLFTTSNDEIIAELSEREYEIVEPEPIPIPIKEIEVNPE